MKVINKEMCVPTGILKGTAFSFFQILDELIVRWLPRIIEDLKCDWIDGFFRALSWGAARIDPELITVRLPTP